MFSTLEIVAGVIAIGAIALFINALVKGGRMVGGFMDKKAARRNGTSQSPDPGSTP
jgi:hypothetical protein